MNGTRTATSSLNGGHMAPGAGATRAEEESIGTAPAAESYNSVLIQTAQTGAESERSNPVGRSPFRKLFAASIGLLVVLFAGYAGYQWWIHARQWVKTDNAYVSAHIHSISSRIAGTVKEVLVEEHQTVVSGAVLARLDPRDFEVRKQQALAQVAQARAQVQQAEAQAAQARAQIVREQARATQAKNDLRRAQSL
ncbi:MAG TPA: biotin/lipoyl-binding protein, partial [Clostridia bacterium]|nr:biotin/lipoyl-binding protein [Clostridia bacterium]